MNPDRLAAALADRYRIERELGQGGMATVYLAHDVRHDRKVALKVLRPELAAVLGVERFLAEIRTTANLQHPHILPLFDSGTVQASYEPPNRQAAQPPDRPTTEFLYYVMPFVEGESLRARLAREKQLPVGDAVRIAAQVAGALDHAHRHGVIHRDIKPENILLQDGEAVVADFGIALAVDAAGGSRVTETGVTIGTPQYMSPEQALGERDLDGRSDIYSLGAVLYEMLAGEPPFTGVTAQAIIAKRLSHPVHSVRTLRESVSEAVDVALERALARAPADRFATAAEFATAITGTAEVPSARSAPAARAGRRAWLALAGALVLLAIAAVALFRWQGRPPPALDPNLIAIAPFDVIGPDLAVWHEGVVDLLSRTLDGAGSLRTVSPSVVLRRWEGRSDRASATMLAGRVGAGLAATGSVSQQDDQTIRLQASLFDITRGDLIGEVQVEGSPARVGELVDSLGLEMLRTLSRDRPVAAVRQATIATVPLAALKAFLVGEQYYRRSLYDSALVAYSEAIAKDTAFTLAYSRMATVLGWDPPSAGVYEVADSFLARAIVRNKGLSPRDSLILLADSLGWSGDHGRTEHYRPMIALREEAARRYPGDPEVWHLLGENRFHLQRGLGRDVPKALAAFERAVTLDPGFSPAYEHLLQVTLFLSREDLALRYAGVIAGLPATAGRSSLLGPAARLLLLPERDRAEALARIADSAGVTALFRAGGEVFALIPDSGETAVHLLRRLASRTVREGESSPWVVDSLMRLRFVATALATRGHLREAYEADRALMDDPGRSRFSWFQDYYLELAMMGVIPAAEASRTFDPVPEPGVPANFSQRSWVGLPWLAARRDTAALARFERRMSEAGAGAVSAAERVSADYLRDAAAAHLALIRGDTALALARFGALPDSACGFRLLRQCFLQQATEATLLVARGDDRGAAALIDAWITDPLSLSPVGVLTRLERARIAERLDDRPTALRHYQYVVAAWRHADPELSPYVTQAREGLARLVGEPQ